MARKPLGEKIKVFIKCLIKGDIIVAPLPFRLPLIPAGIPAEIKLQLPGDEEDTIQAKVVWGQKMAGVFRTKVNITTLSDEKVVEYRSYLLDILIGVIALAEEKRAAQWFKVGVKLDEKLSYGGKKYLKFYSRELL